MKKSLLPMLAVIGALAFVVLANILFNKPPTTLNEEYINSWILMDDEPIDKILFTSQGNNYTTCICSVSDDELMLLVLQNNETFDMHFRQTIALDTLTDDPANTMTDALLSEENIMYNIFLNPQTDSVKIGDREQTIYTLQHNEYTIGFWWFEMN